MSLITLAAVTAILLTSAGMVLVVMIAERGRTKKEAIKAERLECILRETIQASLTSDERTARERRARASQLYDVFVATPHLNGGF